ncbi:HPP family protein [Hyphomicrobium sp. D-2]|uniref:HPP family protein n=1 Tax=Hyphomicrobium sp. D-2 TaxID=3041621 RepID=UPI002458CFAF|nr:HPP family protein [Hyphomicrobium sp. D-2]MDH4980661.1 HPP family protein [Hyphomicrobium sp. D-2]
MLRKFRSTVSRLQKRIRSSLFVPILAGATLRERLLACVGALVGILLTGFICQALYGDSIYLPLIVAPIGASAVLLFAVPSSPLAQPWPIIGGNVISAIIGIACANLIDHAIIAPAVAVSAAILLMSFTRCLHPPGGATALTAAIAHSDYLFPFLPVGLNSFLLVAIGIGFHAMTRRKYPHVATPAAQASHGTKDLPAPARVGIQSADIDAALALLDETFDIDPADLERLLRQVEHEALVRTNAETRCGDIMSRDVISVDADCAPAIARALLLKHNLRTLPVTDRDGQLLGTVGLRELTPGDDKVSAVLSEAVTASEHDPALALLAPLTNGRTHAVVIVGNDRRVRGLITQTDLLALLAQKLSDRRAAA